jgi:hypothetical protein
MTQLAPKNKNEKIHVFSTRVFLHSTISMMREKLGQNIVFGRGYLK